MEKISEVKFFLMAYYQIGAEGTFRKDLAVAAGEYDPGAFVFPAHLIGETSDVPFGSLSQGTCVNNYEAGVSDGALGKTGFFQIVVHYIRIPLIGLATGCMYIVFHRAIGIADFSGKGKSDMCTASLFSRLTTLRFRT